MSARSWKALFGLVTVGMVVAGIPSPAPADRAAAPAVAQLAPNNLQVEADCPRPRPACTSGFVSDQIVPGGTSEDPWISVQVEIADDTDATNVRNIWFWCPPGTPEFPSDEDLKSCKRFGIDRIGWDVPAGPARPFSTAIDVPAFWDGRIVAVLAVMCSGPGIELEGPDANCTTDVERGVYLEDAQSGRRNRTSVGAVDAVRTAPECLGSTSPECAGEFRDFPLGSEVPGDGFDFNAITSRSVNELQWVLNGPVETASPPSPENFAASGTCSLDQTIEGGKTWLCFLSDEDVPDGTTLALALMKGDAPGSQRQGRGGYCNSNNNPRTDQDPRKKGVQRPAPRNRIRGAHDYCVLDSHYIVSSRPDE